MDSMGSVRREAIVDRIVKALAEDGPMTPRERFLSIGAARLGMIEAVRASMFMPDMSPSRRLALEKYWGLAGTERVQREGHP